MRAIVCGIVVVVVAGIAGCGGGGGGQSSLLTTLSPEIVGTYYVQGLNLPGDEMGVKPNGDVVVNSETSGTRGSSEAKIGSCDAQGTLLLNGSWTSGGTDYTISATGSIVPASGGLTLEGTVAGGNLVTQQDTTIYGTKIADDMLRPPPPPDIPDSGDGDMLKPPPPPDY